MQTVIETPTFLADAKSAGVAETEREDIVSTIVANPETGDLIVGTGGARKVRIAGKGKGKSGGYRIITYLAALDVPTMLLALVSKGERSDISQAERNALRPVLAIYAESYRAEMMERARRLSTKRPANE